VRHTPSHPFAAPVTHLIAIGAGKLRFQKYGDYSTYSTSAFVCVECGGREERKGESSFALSVDVRFVMLCVVHSCSHAREQW
jgi:hypothetical protein